jgi:hypothetical protein
MSVVWSLLVLVAALPLPAAEIETLNGDRHVGELIELTSESAVLKQGPSSVTLPLAGILEVRFPATSPPEAATGSRVAFIDGTRLTLASFSIAGDKAHCETSFGKFSLGVARVSHLRFGISTSKLDETWAALLTRESKNDLLVVKKEEVLDFLSGEVGDVAGKGDAGEKIGFLLDGDEVPVAREKVYGIIFHRRAPSLPKSICQVRLTQGDSLQVAKLAWNGSELKVSLVAGSDLVVPATLVAAIDFSSDRMKYLSDLKPRDVQYVPFFDIYLYEYRRDRSLDGTPLTLAGKSYARGLAIHSKATLRYRIGGEYTRFRAVAGIDDSVRGQNKHENVQLVISGDGKRLFDQEVKTTDAPCPIDLDVAGVRDLEILVDFGSDMRDIADHLDLADAKLVK